jgi:hypothetical protein
MNMKTKANQKLEHAIHETLKREGFLFPISDEEIENFESRFTQISLPERLKNPKDILERNVDKIFLEKQSTMNVAALFDSTEPDGISESKLEKEKKNSRGKGKKR